MSCETVPASRGVRKVRAKLTLPLSAFLKLPLIRKITTEAWCSGYEVGFRAGQRASAFTAHQRTLH